MSPPNALEFTGSICVNFVASRILGWFVTGIPPTLLALGVLSCYNANMKALEYKPKGFWRLDDTAPFQDYSGYNNSGTLAGTETHGIALSTDAVYSQRFNRNVVATLPSPIYRAGTENQPFSMSATVYPIRQTEGNVAQTYRENIATAAGLPSPLGTAVVTNN